MHLLLREAQVAGPALPTHAQSAPPQHPVFALHAMLPLLSHPPRPRLFSTGEPFELHGVILRSTLLHLLRSRRGFADPQQAATLLARQQQQQDGGSGLGGLGSSRGGPGRAVLSNGSADYAAAAAAQQLE